MEEDFEYHSLEGDKKFSSHFLNQGFKELNLWDKATFLKIWKRKFKKFYKMSVSSYSKVILLDMPFTNMAINYDGCKYFFGDANWFAQASDVYNLMISFIKKECPLVEIVSVKYELNHSAPHSVIYGGPSFTHITHEGLSWIVDDLYEKIFNKYSGRAMTLHTMMSRRTDFYYLHGLKNQLEEDKKTLQSIQYELTNTKNFLEEQISRLNEEKSEIEKQKENLLAENLQLIQQQELVNAQNIEIKQKYDLSVLQSEGLLSQVESLFNENKHLAKSYEALSSEKEDAELKYDKLLKLHQINVVKEATYGLVLVK